MKRTAAVLHNLFFSTIRRKLVLTFLLLIILPIAVSSIISLTLLQEEVKSKANIGNEMALSQAAISIERVFRDMLVASNTLMLDDEVADILKKDTPAEQTKLFYNQSMMNSKFFKTQTSTLDYYFNNFIALIDRNGYVYTTIPMDASDSTGVFKRIMEEERVAADANYVKLGESTHSIHYSPLGKKIPYIVLMRAFMDLTFGTKKGDLLVGVPETEISGILKGFAAVHGIKGYVINGKGEIISSTEEAELGGRLPYFSEINKSNGGDINFLQLDKPGVIINARNLERLGWRVVEVIPNPVLFAEITTIRNSLIYLNLGFLLAFFGLAYVIARSISRPIRKLDAATTEIAAGNWEARVDVLRKDELGKLSVKFNKMAAQIHELFHKVNEDQKTKRELELKMLYAQINPHFLFNTLNSIRWMADASKVFNVSKVIVALASLLKSSIMRTDEYITVREEIENVKNYVTIQKFRYASLFTDEYEIADDILDCSILKLILQPIVENSIIHGFDGIAYKGVIRIKAYKEDGKIIVSVSDNGVGVSREELDAIIAGRSSSKGRFSGIGVHNVNGRLTLHYGSEYALSMQSAPGEGMVTKVTVPVIGLNKETALIDEWSNRHV